MAGPDTGIKTVLINGITPRQTLSLLIRGVALKVISWQLLGMGRLKFYCDRQFLIQVIVTNRPLLGVLYSAV